jgi:NAD(P)-dependent dehydrogenase (short-subunit alcohol dehydrogenase family)
MKVTATETQQSRTEPCSPGRAAPYGRMGRREEVADAAVFLASSSAESNIGRTPRVDDGNMLSARVRAEIATCPAVSSAERNEHSDGQD